VNSDSKGITADEREQRRRFVLILYARAAVVTALFGSTLFFTLAGEDPKVSATQILLFAVVLLVYILTGGYLIWLRRPRERLGLHVQSQIVLDVLVATALVYVTGSVESPFTFFYALPVINTAVFYPRRGTFLTAGLSCLCLSALFILESQEILPTGLEGRVGEPPSGGRVAYLLALNYVVFFAIAWLSGYLAEQLRQAGRELKRTEGDLEKLEVLNRDIVISMRSGLMAVDLRGAVSLLNPVAEQILGCPAHQVLGRPAAEVFPAVAGLLEKMSKGDPEIMQRQEVQHQRSEDRLAIPVGLTLSVLKNPDGRDAGILVHMQDLSDQKQMEALVKRAERMAALGVMAAGIAHEVRNPLASISGAVQMLSVEENLDGEDRRLMEIVKRETERLNLLISDFLLYARPREPQPRKCSLKDLVEETVSVFQRSTDEGDTKVNCHLDEVESAVDPDQIRQVLWNLLTNAARAVDGAGEVQIHLKARDGGGVQIEVADNGPGVPEDLRLKIFEPFFTTREEGSGLGLATVSRIIEAHRGSIELECPAGGGSRFIVRLPGVE
jgi:two-component system sensor histidine kinase PilS (NtrC family)